MVDKIKALILEKGVTIGSFCEEMGIAKNAMSEWKSGRIKPSIDTVVKMAQYFGVTTDYLLIAEISNTATKGNGYVRVDLTKEMREYLIQLRPFFIFLHDFKGNAGCSWGTRVQGDSLYDYALPLKEEYVDIVEGYKGLLDEFGVSFESIEKWRYKDFDLPPSKVFLDRCIDLYDRYYSGNSKQSISNLKETVNDYNFEVGLASAKENQLLTEKEATDFVKRRLIDSGLLSDADVGVQSIDELVSRLTTAPRKAN